MIKSNKHRSCNLTTIFIHLVKLVGYFKDIIEISFIAYTITNIIVIIPKCS